MVTSFFSILFVLTTIFQPLISPIMLDSRKTISSNSELMQLLEFKTNPLSTDPFWVTLPKGPEKLDIFLKTANVNRTEFWIVPVGTETWKERKYLGSGVETSIGVWKFTFQYGTEDLYNHIVIKLLSNDSVADYTFGVKIVRNR